MVNKTEHLKMKTKVEHVIERNYDDSIFREIYRVFVTEERPTSSGNHLYDHVIWVGECKAANWEWMKRRARKEGARFRGVQEKLIDTHYVHERD
jgi:hypothetical protein